jgi:hypothetical protein
MPLDGGGHGGRGLAGAQHDGAPTWMFGQMPADQHCRIGPVDGRLEQFQQQIAGGDFKHRARSCHSTAPRQSKSRFPAAKRRPLARAGPVAIVPAHEQSYP